MNDSQVFLMKVTNLALGLVVLGSLAGTLIAVAAELIVRIRRKLECDAELRHLFRHLK